jgi:hypothetical protein
VPLEKEDTEQHKNIENNAKILEECGLCPDLASYTPSFALQLRKKHGKNLSQGMSTNNVRHHYY